ncbi:hypothetical protein STRDD11_00990 [Streptococcus sp. DD11]|nr:hypothetical protein STRDD11_00990 [Streptococcus sp. DD11]
MKKIRKKRKIRRLTKDEFLFPAAGQRPAGRSHLSIHYH